MHQYEFFFISLGLFCYFCILSVALGRDIKECLLVIVTVFNQFSLGNSNLPVIRLDTITTADFLDVIAHTKPSAKNLSQKYTAWQREFESVWQEKKPKDWKFPRLLLSKMASPCLQRIKQWWGRKCCCFRERECSEKCQREIFTFKI